MIYPVPKPRRRKRVKACRVSRTSFLKRSRMKCGAGSKRRGKSSFPKQRDRKYTKWLVSENRCLLAGRFTRERLSSLDINVAARYNVPARMAYEHCCWYGDRGLDPAHVGKHRAKGAPDFGVTVPLCPAAHSFYDEHRDDWKRVTGYSEKQMASAASGFALRYVERGGIPQQQGAA